MKCSECGKEICVMSPTTYKYKCHNSTYSKKKSHDISIEEIEKYSHFQCSYTCYDHALLRTSKESRKMDKKKYNNAVIKNEETMIAQGKTILEPIPLRER